MNIYYLDDERIAKMPEKVVKVYLTNCDLVEALELLKGCVNLLSLEVYINGQAEVPSSIANFKQLKSLKIIGGAITAIADEVRYLTCLETLNLPNSPLLNLAKNIKPSESIRQDTHLVRRLDSQPLLLRKRGGFSRRKILPKSEF